MHATTSLPGARPLIVVAPDSFKGSLSATDVAAAMASGILRARPDAQVVQCPMADGGEGTLDALANLTRRVFAVPARNAAGQGIEVSVAELDDGAVLVEVAMVVGLADARNTVVPVLHRSTLGVGDAVRHLLDLGCRRIGIALGGSCTNDGGAGFLCALGLKLHDADGLPLAPTPADLERLADIDVSALDPRLAECDLFGLVDVESPLIGDHGATVVFGRQKGLPTEALARVDQVLAGFARRLEERLGRAASAVAGAGAAGGLGFAIKALGGRLVPGAEYVAAAAGIDQRLREADWAITGEGRSDAQTLRGKAPDIVSRHARALSTPITLLSGGIDPEAIGALGAAFDGCFSAVPGPITLSQAIESAAANLADTAEQLTRLRFAGVRT